LPGTFELFILIAIFLVLQAWWIIPIFRRHNEFNSKGENLKNQINILEKLYKK